MSASSIGRNASMRTAQARKDKPNQSPAAKELANKAEETRQTGLGKVAAYIPSEAVTLYVGVLAVMVSVPDAEKAQPLVWSAWAVAVINVLLILASFMEALDPTNRWKSFWGTLGSLRFWLAGALSTAALVVYMYVLPGNPFLTEGWQSALLVLFAGVGIPLLGNILGVLPVQPASETANGTQNQDELTPEETAAREAAEREAAEREAAEQEAARVGAR